MTSKKRQKRSNADDAVRKAERAWLANKKDKELLLAYWKACLRADIIPLPTHEVETTDVTPDRWWVYHGDAKGSCHVSCILDGDTRSDYYMVTIRDLEDRRILGQEQFNTRKECDPQIKEYLRFLIELVSSKENPRRRARNGDAEIRKLERIANTTEAPADYIAYWKASLRAGEIPPPNVPKTYPQFQVYAPEKDVYQHNWQDALRLIVYDDGFSQIRTNIDKDGNRQEVARNLGVFRSEEIHLAIAALIEAYESGLYGA